MPGSSKLSPSLTSSHKNPVCTSPFPHTWCMPRPSHSWFHIWSVVVIIKSFPLPCYLVPIRPKYLPQHSILETPPDVPRSVWQTKFHIHNNPRTVKLI
jgi:hypothetical protein